MAVLLYNNNNLPSTKLSDDATILTIMEGFCMAKDDINLQIGQRWASALKKRFPERNTVKLVAKSFDIEVRTARSWLEGQAPRCQHLFVAGQKFGMGILFELFSPNKKVGKLEDSLLNLEKKIYQLGQDLRAIRERGDL